MSTSAYAEKTVIWTGGIAVLLSLAISGFVLWSSSHQDRVAVQNTLETASLLLERSITHAVSSVDTALSQIQSGSRQTPPGEESRVLQRLVSESLKSSPHIRQVLVIDAQSIILADSAGPDSIGQRLSPDAYGLEQSGPLSLGSRLRIGRASAGRYINPGLAPVETSLTAPDGPWVIPVMLGDEANTPEPRQVIAAMNPGWFLESLSAARPGPNGEAIITRLDGPVLAALPLYLDTGAPSRSAILGGISGSTTLSRDTQIHEEPALLSRKPGLHARRLSDIYPLSLVLTAVEEDVRANWLKNNHLLLVAMVLTPLGLGLLFIFIALEARNHHFLGERVRLLSRAVEQGPAALMITSPDGAILYINQHFTDLFGYTLADIEGRNPRFLKSGMVDNQIYKGMWDTLGAGNVWHGELINRTRGGELRWIETTIAPARDGRGRPVCYVSIQSDITGRKASLDHLKAQLNLLDTANSGLERFALATVHAVQGPLQTTSAFLSILHKRHGNTLPREMNEYAGHARQGMRQVQTMVRDLGSYVRASGTLSEARQVDMNIIATEAINTLEHAITETGADIRVDPLPIVAADYQEMQIVLEHLLGNALCLHDPVHVPTITISSEIDGTFWRFCVAGNGVDPIPQTQEHRLGPSMDTGDSDTGTGMIVCRKIIESRGGTLWTENNQAGAGRCFFTLPRIPATGNSNLMTGNNRD